MVKKNEEHPTHPQIQYKYHAQSRSTEWNLKVSCDFVFSDLFVWPWNGFRSPRINWSGRGALVHCVNYHHHRAG